MSDRVNWNRPLLPRDEGGMDDIAKIEEERTRAIRATSSPDPSHARRQPQRAHRTPKATGDADA